MRRTLLILLVLACPNQPHGQTLSDLPLSHPVYDLLDRLETRGVFGKTLPGIRPYSRSLVTHLVEQALLFPALGTPERARLERYKSEHTAQPHESAIRSVFQGHFYSFADSILQVRANPIFRQTIHLVDDETTEENAVSQTYVGVSVDGSFYDHFGFRVQHFEAREWSNLARTTRSDVWARPIETVQLKGKTSDFRETRYQIRVNLPWFGLDFGKESFDWGPGREANVFLQGAAPSYLYGRLRVSHKALTFEHLFGGLRTPPDAADLSTTSTSNGHLRTLPAPKRFVTHRLELELSDRLRFGIHESVVYGDRGFEPAYALPVSILVGAQTYAGETDNVAFGFDLAYRVGRATKLYAAIFFDDLSKFDPGNFSNQVGIQAGGHWAEPMGVPGVDIRAEYARMEPYTYAHNLDINAYTHFDAVLGHPLGPNADRVFLHLQWWLSEHVRLSSAIRHTREGDNYTANGELVNVGGDASQGRRPTDSPTRSFLAGDQTTTTDLLLDAIIAPAAALRFGLSYRHRRERLDLALGGRQPATSSHLFSFSTELNAF